MPVGKAVDKFIGENDDLIDNRVPRQEGLNYGNQLKAAAKSPAGAGLFSVSALPLPRGRQPSLTVASMD